MRAALRRLGQQQQKPEVPEEERLRAALPARAEPAGWSDQRRSRCSRAARCERHRRDQAAPHFARLPPAAWLPPRPRRWPESAAPKPGGATREHQHKPSCHSLSRRQGPDFATLQKNRLRPVLQARGDEANQKRARANPELAQIAAPRLNRRRMAGAGHRRGQRNSCHATLPTPLRMLIAPASRWHCHCGDVGEWLKPVPC